MFLALANIKLVTTIWAAKTLCLFNAMLERFSNDCRKTKVMTVTNHNTSSQRDEPIAIPSNFPVTRSKRGKNHACMVRLVLVLLLIG